MNRDPIPYDGRINRHLRRAQENARTAKLVARIARDTGGDLAQERKKLHAWTPSDSITLRGIPAVGRSVAGAIRHTRPTDCIR